MSQNYSNNYNNNTYQSGIMNQNNSIQQQQQNHKENRQNSSQYNNNQMLQHNGSSSGLKQNSTNNFSQQQQYSQSNLQQQQKQSGIITNTQQQYQNRPVLQDSSNNYANQQSKNITNTNSKLQENPNISEPRDQFTNNHHNSQSNYMKASPNVRNISPDKLIQRLDRDNSDIARLSIDDINKELDKNMNDIIVFLNRRKQLVKEKKNKMISEFMQELDNIKRNSPQELFSQLQRETVIDPEIQALLDNSHKQSQLPPNMYKDLLNPHDTNSDQYSQRSELQQSADFWNQNKQFEGDVDSQLKRLKYYDTELEHSNNEIHSICQKLDSVEESIKELLLQKSEEHLNKAEPFFAKKNQFHDQLKQSLNTKNKLKDEKISLIYSIIQALGGLKNLREGRLADLMQVFGIDPNSESPETQSRITSYIDFVDQLENLAKIREQMVDLESDEQPILQDIERISEENESIFSELVKKQSDEAKAYSEFQENLTKRAIIAKSIEFFMMQCNLQPIAHLEIKEILKRFKDNILFLKPLVEEDQAIRQGLEKTCETIATFTNILKSSENEKERRQELIQVLEECHKLKDLEEVKVEELRNLDLDLTKKQKQKNNLEEDLENILSDADLEQYRKLGNVIKQFENEMNYIVKMKSKSDQEIQSLQNEVVQKMQLIKQEYDDIIRELLPNNLMNTYDFQKAQDIRSVKNQLKKAFKRLLGDQIQNSQLESYM